MSGDDTLPEQVQNKKPQLQIEGSYARLNVRAKIVWLVLFIWALLALGIWASPYLFHATLPSQCTISESLYMALQMLFANASFETDVGSGGVACGVLNPFLHVFRLIAPLVLPVLGVLAFVKSLSLRLRLWLYGARWRVLPGLLRTSALRRPLVVVIGLGYKGSELVQYELEKNMVLVLENQADNLNIPRMESQGAIVWVGDGHSNKDLDVVFWKNPVRVWITCGSDIENLLFLHRCRDILEARPEKTSADGKSEIYAHVSSFTERRNAAALAPLNNDSEKVWTHLFNHEEICAALLVKDLNLFKCGARSLPPRVLLIGLGELGKAVLRELLLICHFPATHLEADPEGGPAVVAVDRDSGAWELTKSELSFLGSTDVRSLRLATVQFIHSDVDQWTFKQYREMQQKAGRAFTHIILAVGTDATNLSFAERISSWEALISKRECEVRPVLYHRDAKAWQETPCPDSPQRVKTFCVEDAYPDYRNWEEMLLPCAKKIHYVYTSAGSGPREHQVKLKGIVEEEWQRCREHDRRSNLALARYLSNRIRSNHDSRTLEKDTWANEETEMACEHSRWMAYQMVENFSLIEASALNRIEDDKKRRVLRKSARVNKDLVTFGDLDDQSRSKDQQIVRERDFVLGRP